MRVYAEIEDQTNKELEQAAILKGSNKKQIILEAIDLYLHQDRSELDQVIKDRDQARSDADQRWKEANQMKSDLNQAKRDLEAARSREDQLRSEVETARSEKDQASFELEGLRRDLEHYKETLQLKADEISFLRAHLSQLSEKITPALPPSQEEAKAKSWWQFWKS
jgi:chromosome segregation ATPase